MSPAAGKSMHSRHERAVLDSKMGKICQIAIFIDAHFRVLQTFDINFFIVSNVRDDPLAWSKQCFLSKPPFYILSDKQHLTNLSGPL